ncbi:RNA polymerase sigma factor [Corynebacterium silvaticum]|uniref:Sigma factor n=1 Tax=Corynebacterium silvaticum TaxID=2320431 RepID=A0ACD4PZ81_9CORY|nr:sigma factor [Corynebacterium silvaticum]WCV10760.1 sigma factor [Corynebacterium silvaticum]
MTTQYRREAFSATYRSCYSAVLSYIRRRTDGDNAEDLTAEVFTRAWNRWDSRKGADLPWMYGIARNVVLEHYRARDKMRRLKKLCKKFPRAFLHRCTKSMHVLLSARL